MPENRLAQETSPYLRQHKDNPVDWWPWGPEALAEAQKLNKPILLSVGYAACHWCHVMAHESFEDEDTAKLMNSEFINIKVDREERPDVDLLCMDALHVMRHQAGWPITMFLTPKGEPFFGATYFPKTAPPGGASFQDVLLRVATVFKEQPEEVTNHAEIITGALKAALALDGAGEISLERLEEAIAVIAPMFDNVSGGFGTGQKFPQTMVLDFLWRNGSRTSDMAKQLVVTTSLERMSRGGIYDHLGGGFARYTIDSNWLVPHFEKMLYDNALLIELLTRAWQRTSTPLFAARVEETVGWVVREMTLPGGGFASSLDADSDGEEGKFYMWTEAEIDAALGTGEGGSLFKAVYGVGPGGNWEGKTILNQIHQQPPVSKDTTASLDRSKEKLLEIRNTRVRPECDDKVLADWNGLMIAALAEAAMAFARSDWLDTSKAAFNFVAGTMSDGDRLFHSAHGTKARHDGIANDYANMIGAAITLYEVSGEVEYLDKAIAWTGVLDTHFWDSEMGNYFFVADDAEKLAVRMRAVNDEAVPTANGSMIGHLTKLWLLTGKDAYNTRAARLLKAFGNEALQYPMGFGSYLVGAEIFFTPIQIVIIGRRDQAGTEALLHEVFKAPVPTRVLQIIDPGQTLPKHHPAAGKKQDEHKPTAYVCVGTTCSLPVTSAPALAHLLAAPLISS